jgi:hypothetical protein
MPSKDLTTSTGKRVVFSGGVLGNDYIRLWDPAPSDFPIEVYSTESGSPVIRLWGDVFSSHADLIFDPLQSRGTTGDLEDPITRRVRYVCKAIVDRMPEQALPELCETLSDIWLFHRDRSAKEVRLLQAPSQEIRATVGQTYPRPEFHVTTE